MGREVKRVALDFDWPLKETWEGFLNPHYKKCPECENGETAASVRLGDLVRLILISGEDSLRGEQYPWSVQTELFHQGNPGKDMAELTTGLAGRPPDGPIGHDCLDGWSAKKKIIAAAGLDPEVWGTCTACKGEAIDQDAKKAYDAWEKTEPPAGDGWQMWETTSDGSPISPVMKTPEELARWLANNGASAFGKDTATYDQWLGMIGVGWAPSAVGSSETGLISGVAATKRGGYGRPADTLTAFGPSMTGGRPTN